MLQDLTHLIGCLQLLTVTNVIGILERDRQKVHPGTIQVLPPPAKHFLWAFPDG